ncbi:MAG TPA: carbamoyltransferase C-terminal domain-containing protein [Verrucomicrobiae bacterium]|nr:carbamoyltransferase C-terminal domain-containing protein [Verrucomicrobiae bacterium]
MAVILGINAFHADSAACVVIDGELKFAVAEERLEQREKHCPRFPENAIRRSLQESGVSLNDVTHVAIARNPKANYRAKMAYVARRPVKAAGAVWEHFRRNSKTQSTIDQLAAICEEDAARVKFETVWVEHHLAHIASAYYVSPFESLTAGFSYDASGDFVSAMAARCEGSHIEVLDRVYLPHSLGFFYTALCQFIGFDEFGEEYKVMGLAPYGEDRYADLMQEWVSLNGSGWFHLKPGYFGMHEGGQSGAVDDRNHIIMGRLYTDAIVKRLGPPRQRTEPLQQRDKDIARSVQVRFEDVAMHCMRKLEQLVPGTDQLVMAGGCALNGVANARILRESRFQKYYNQCAASDDGTCLGAAYYCWHEILGQNKRFYMNHAYWGPEYPESQLKQTAESSGHAVHHYPTDAQLVEAVADLLVQGKVVGWYQGRSEWGPRALGNRSILANPSIPNMKDIINTKIKRRESFRPFAPTVLKEYVSTYFEQDILSPFMMHVVKIRPEWRPKLPAITHVDGTGRLQSIERSHNPLYYDLIEAFRRRSGVATLLNTSFNENEPIVDTPEQAVACFSRNDIDTLALGHYVVSKLS